MKNPINPLLYMICMVALVLILMVPANAESESKKIQLQADDHYSLNESPSHKQINSPGTWINKQLNPKPLNSKHLTPKQLYLKPLNSKHLINPLISFSYENIKDVKVTNSYNQSGGGTGAIIGGVIGLGIGVIIGASIEELQGCDDGCWIGSILISGAIGALIGLGLGALFSGKSNLNYSK